MVVKKVLVTGAAGFVGSHLVENLVRCGYQVVGTVFDQDKVNHLEPWVRSHKSVELLTGDIRSADFVGRAVRGCSEVYHLAATLNAPGVKSEEFHSTNVVGTRNVMDAALDAGVRKVVVTSTIACLKDSAERVDETHLAAGVFDGDYALTKYKAEKVAFEYGCRGIEVTVVNPTIVYGPRETHTLGQIFRNYLEPPVRFVSFPDSVLNLIFVDDAVEGFVLAMEKGKSGHRYILGGPEISLGEFVALLDTVSGVRKPVVTLPNFALDLGVRVLDPLMNLVGRHSPILPAQVRAMRRGTAVDISKSLGELGVPQRPIIEGVKKSLEWYKRTGYIQV